VASQARAFGLARPLEQAHVVATLVHRWPPLAASTTVSRSASVAHVPLRGGVSLLLTLTAYNSFAAASAFSFLIGVGLGLSATPLLIAVQTTCAHGGASTRPTVAGTHRQPRQRVRCRWARPRRTVRG
jgi:hypothetical protein